MNIERIFLVISLIFMVIMYTKMLNMEKKSLENFNNNDIVEHMTDDMKNQMKEMIHQEYNYDLEAIRNLGAISKSLLTGKNYHSNDVSLSSISYTENTGELCNSSVVSTAATYELAKSTCDSNADCQGFTKTVDGTFEIHDSISGFAERGAQAANSCYIKQQTEGTLENNNLIIPANVNTLGNTNVTGTLSVGGYELLPPGCIIIWAHRSRIPNGWVPCDGSPASTAAGAPNLRNKFLLGENHQYQEAGHTGDKSVQATGGEERTMEVPNHRHYIAVNQSNRLKGVNNENNVTMITNYGYGMDGSTNRSNPNFEYTLHGVRDREADRGLTSKQVNDNGEEIQHDNGVNNMPPYYVVIYIMKVY
jgi:hypothetical protein